MGSPIEEIPMPQRTTCVERRVDDTTARDHESDALTRLRPLLDVAGQLDLEDREGWNRFRHAARTTTTVLVTGGVLPAHLAVRADDPPALIARTIAAAWRHATSTSS
jgi:hypothetical protein